MNIGLTLLNLALRLLTANKPKMQKALDKAKVKAAKTQSKTDDYRVLVLQFMLDNVPG